MKKIIVFAVVTGLVFAAAAAAVGTASIVYARSQSAPTTPPDGTFFGRGMMNGGGMMSGRSMMGQGSFFGRTTERATGVLHEYIIAALAPALNLTPEEIQAKLDEGQTLVQVATAAGLTTDEITVQLQAAHTAALKAAVEAGTLTQEQADWMQQRQEQMGLNGVLGAGGCQGGGMMHGLRGNQ